MSLTRVSQEPGATGTSDDDPERFTPAVGMCIPIMITLNQHPHLY